MKMIENMRKVKVIGNILIVMGLLLLIIPLLVNSNTPLLPIAGVVIVCIGYVFFFLFWRCPFCHKHLPFNGMIGMENCPYCGNEIDT